MAEWSVKGELFALIYSRPIYLLIYQSIGCIGFTCKQCRIDELKRLEFLKKNFVGSSTCSQAYHTLGKLVSKMLLCHKNQGVLMHMLQSRH